MSSVRRVLTPLAIALLLIALPWTATASSNEARGGTVTTGCSATISITSGDSGVDIGVTYSGLNVDENYQYFIKVYRVDAHYRHVTKTGNVTTYDYDGDGVGDDVYVMESWMPVQDGPYTVRASLYDFDGNFIVDSNTTFGWGDVEGNSAPASVGISLSPEQDYYDFAGDIAAQENVSVSFESENLETGATYGLQYRMYQIEESEDGVLEEFRLFAMSTFATSAHYNMSALGDTTDSGWTNGTTYRLEVKLWLEYEDSPIIATDEFLFTIGEAPPILKELLEVKLDCDLNEDTVWYMVLDDDDGDHTLYCNLYNPNPVAINGTTVLTHRNLGSAGIDSSIGDFSLDSNGTQNETFHFDWGDTERYEINGTMTLEFYFVESELTSWIGGNVTYTIDFVIENGTVTIPEVYGCIDPTASNYDSDANIDDGSCVHDEPEPEPEPLSVTITSTKIAGEAPLDVSFVAGIFGGQGPYTIQWEVGTSLIESPELDYQFSSGEHVVVLSVVDVDGRTATDMMEISVTEPTPPPPVIDPLTGYIAHSLQMNSTDENMTGAMEFTGVASGGVAPYSFQWSFEWLDSQDSFLLGEKQQKIIRTATGETTVQDFENAGNYTVTLTITDSEGTNHNAEVLVEIVKSSDDDEALILEPEPPEEGEQQIEELGILIASTGGLGLLMLFGLAGRKRKDDLLDKLRAQNAEGWSTEENALWDKDLGRFD